MIGSDSEIDDDSVIREILHNRARCLKCNDIVESTHRYDFRRCECGNMFVDGGKAYLRRGAKDLKDIEDLSVFGDPIMDAYDDYE